MWTEFWMANAATLAAAVLSETNGIGPEAQPDAPAIGAYKQQ